MTDTPPPSSPTRGAPSPSARPPRDRVVQYKGADLDAERGPGLGCFWLQVALLVVLVVATPVTVSLGFPSEVSAVLLFATIGLLLLTGQTVIFLLRLVAADRRTRRRPLASATPTVGEIEDVADAARTPANVPGSDADDDVRQ